MDESFLNYLLKISEVVPWDQVTESEIDPSGFQDSSLFSSFQRNDLIISALKELTVTQRLFTILVCIGYKQYEIANLFWVTESYISNELKKVKRKIKDLKLLENL